MKPTEKIYEYIKNKSNALGSKNITIDNIDRDLLNMRSYTLFVHLKKLVIENKIIMKCYYETYVRERSGKAGRRYVREVILL